MAGLARKHCTTDNISGNLKPTNASKYSDLLDDVNISGEQRSPIHLAVRQSAPEAASSLSRIPRKVNAPLIFINEKLIADYEIHAQNLNKQQKLLEENTKASFQKFKELEEKSAANFQKLKELEEVYKEKVGKIEDTIEEKLNNKFDGLEKKFYKTALIFLAFCFISFCLFAMQSYTNYSRGDSCSDCCSNLEPIKELAKKVTAKTIDYFYEEYCNIYCCKN